MDAGPGVPHPSPSRFRSPRVETSTALDPRIAELRCIDVLHDLPDEDLAWLL